MAVSSAIAEFIAFSPLRRAAAISEGLPVAALREMLADPAIRSEDVVHIIAPRRTVDRRLRENGRLNRDESDRLSRWLRVLSLATDIFGSRAAAIDWLDAPKRRFDGQRPMHLLGTDAGTGLVEEVLQQARYGVAA